MIPEVKEAQQKFRALKHQYDNARNDPAKRQAWKKQEGILNATYKKYRSKDKKDDLTQVTDTKDMAKLTKFAKSGPLKEIGLVIL